MLENTIEFLTTEKTGGHRAPSRGQDHKKILHVPVLNIYKRIYTFKISETCFVTFKNRTSFLIKLNPQYQRYCNAKTDQQIIYTKTGKLKYILNGC